MRSANVLHARHALKGDGSDESTAWQEIVTNLPDQSTLILEPGRTYGFAGVNYANKSLTIVADGATVNLASDNYLLRATATPTTYTPTAIVEETMVLPDNDESVSHVYTKLTFASAPSVELSDLVRVVADDPIPGSPTGTATQKKRMAQYARVVHISGTDVYVTRLREIGSYTTGLRMMVHGGHKLAMQGGTYKCLEDTSAWSPPFGVIQVRAMESPTFHGVNFRDMPQMVLRLMACYAPRVVSCDWTNIQNDLGLDPDRAGYGVTAEGSEYGVMSACTGSYLRHLFTTSISNVLTGSDPYFYGRSALWSVTGCAASSCLHSPFDTHSDAYGVEFANCHATGVAAGSSSSAAGFTLRGVGSRVNGGSARNVRRGVEVINVTTGEQNSLSDIINVSIDASQWGIRVADGAGTTMTGRTYISGGRVEAPVGLRVEQAGPVFWKDVEWVGATQLSTASGDGGASVVTEGVPN